MCADHLPGVRIWFYDQIGFSGAKFQGLVVGESAAFAGQWLESLVEVTGGSSWSVRLKASIYRSSPRRPPCRWAPMRRAACSSTARRSAARAASTPITARHVSEPYPIPNLRQGRNRLELEIQDLGRPVAVVVDGVATSSGRPALELDERPGMDCAARR